MPSRAIGNSSHEMAVEAAGMHETMRSVSRTEPSLRSRVARAAACLGLLVAAWSGGAPRTEGAPPPSETILKPFGLQRFPQQCREAVDAYFSAEEAYLKEDYAGALKTLDDFWKKYPAGSKSWKEFQLATKPLDDVADFGGTPCYAALRMLTDCAEWRTGGDKPPAAPATIRITILLIGKLKGVEPRTLADLKENQGDAVLRSLDPALSGPDAGKIFDDAYWLFEEYVHAMTKGRAKVKRVVVPMPDLVAPATLREEFAGLDKKAADVIWEAVPRNVQRATDWWHFVYPSHVPSGSAFAGKQFVTGGMGFGPGNDAPRFMSHDEKLLRSANQNGRRLLTSPERRAALPGWFQHEFFHYVYRSYPQLKLEATTHLWMKRREWPADFEGVVESDYFHESLYKRLQLQERLPMHVRFKYAAEPAAGE